MIKTLSSVALISILSLGATPLHAQSDVTLDGAAVEASPRNAQAGLKLEDWQRKTRAGGNQENLDMRRVVGTVAWPLADGLSVRGEVGWHDPDYAAGQGDGGPTWGVGGTWRALRAVLRDNPRFGPRDWVALQVAAGLQGGQASSGSGDIDWTLWQARIGAEWHTSYVWPRRGEYGVRALTLEGGMAWNSLDASRAGISGSTEQEVGTYLQARFDLGRRTFTGIEADWFGGSDRRLALTVGTTF